ncbi:MAG: CidA/LrgA family protein [Campylobacteraceae bacterium]
MLKGILTLLVFQFIGECFVKLFELKIPGAIIGMVLLLLFLLRRKSSFASLDSTVLLLLKYLPLFIVPAAIGIITQLETISKEFVAISISLVVGTFVALAFCAKLIDVLITKKEKR